MKLWTANELGKATNFSGRHIRRFIASGVIQAQQLGREWIISDEEAQKFILSRSKKSEETVEE